MQNDSEKSIVNLTVYEVDKHTQLYSYTATLCAPCRRIKPVVAEIMSKHNCKIIHQELIEKNDFKKTINEFVPFFVVMSQEFTLYPEGLKKIDSIQTSERIQLTNFLAKNKIGALVLDDDF